MAARLEEAYWILLLPPELRRELRAYLRRALCDHMGAGYTPVVYFSLHKVTHTIPHRPYVPLHATMLPHRMWLCLACKGMGTQCRCSFDRVVDWLCAINADN